METISFITAVDSLGESGSQHLTPLVLGYSLDAKLCAWILAAAWLYVNRKIFTC